MAEIQTIFREALGCVVGESWGAQTQAAQKAGMTPQALNKYLSGESKRGSEDERRAIAAALGYPGARYEAFLDIGRRKLRLPVVAKNATTPPPPEVSALLGAARRVLEGPKRAALEAVIKAMGEHDDLG